jgi:hypothetical protein
MGSLLRWWGASGRRCRDLTSNIARLTDTHACASGARSLAQAFMLTNRHCSDIGVSVAFLQRLLTALPSHVRSYLTLPGMAIEQYQGVS